MRYNPSAMMIDGGGDTVPNNPVLKRQFTPQELQAIIRKLTSGQPLTPEEAAAVGVSEPKTIISTEPVDVKPKGKKIVGGILIDGETGSPFSGVHTDGKTYKDGKVVSLVEDVPVSGTPAGFTAGPFPKELEQFFGSSAGTTGYRIITNPDGSQQLEVATSPGSTKTFGLKFSVDNAGK
jgi:hypothetical protein